MQVDETKSISTIAFGSCNKQDKSQKFWEDINQINPDLWVWLGDNVYADTEDMKLMASKYRQLSKNKYYREFCSNTPVIGTWDDHDYGVNDGNSTYESKEESAALMLSFLGVDPTREVWTSPGVYQSYTFGESGKKVKVILLDTRTFQTPLKPDENSKQRYIPDESGDILGQDQWTWLESELKNSDADVHIICSSLQVIPSQHYFEKWSNFPGALDKLYAMLYSNKVKAPIILSGDRHTAEISQIGLGGTYRVYEVTSSGLTHAYTTGGAEDNMYRMGPQIKERNFGVLKINWRTPLEVAVQIRKISGQVAYEEILMF